VCREHFTPDDFEGPATLRYEAVPSQFTNYSRSLMDKQNPTSAKRFRSDMNMNSHVRSSSSIVPNKRTSMNYRQCQTYGKQDDEHTPMISLSPTRDINDDNLGQLQADIKSSNDIDLTMNCFEEQLTEVQMSHRAVKVNFSRRRVSFDERSSSMCTRRSDAIEIYSGEREQM
jgi:hypothetical protein